MHPLARRFDDPSFRGRVWRLLVTAILGVLLVSEPLRLVHLVVIQHGVCIEHGEVIHVDGSESSDGRGITDFQAVYLGDSGAHEHEHCTLGCINRQAATLPGAVDERLELPPADPREAAFVECGAKSLSVLSYAPKQSPPGLA